MFRGRVAATPRPRRGSSGGSNIDRSRYTTILPLSDDPAAAVVGYDLWDHSDGSGEKRGFAMRLELHADGAAAAAKRRASPARPGGARVAAHSDGTAAGRSDGTAAAVPDGTITPVHLYRFENMSSWGQDSAAGQNDLIYDENPDLGLQLQQGDATSVGSFVVLGYSKESSLVGWPSDPVSWSAKATSAVPAGAAGITVEFLIHPTPQCFLRGGSATILSSNTGSVYFEIASDKITFQAKADGDVEGEGNLEVPLDGAGVLASDSLWATSAAVGQWHHVALVRDAKTAAQSIFIDGESQPAMRVAGGAGRDGGMRDLGSLIVDLKDATFPCYGLDELAVYDVALSDAAVASRAASESPRGCRRDPLQTSTPPRAERRLPEQPPPPP